MTPDGLQQLVSVCQEIFQATGLLGQEPPLLYHYTDHAALLGIVSNSCLWATNAKFLNDASEVKYGSKIAISAISERLGREKYAPLQSALETTRNWLLSVEGPSSSIQPELTDAYVVCFCELPNLLSQWRMYSSGGGYAVGFDFGNKKPSRWEGTGRQAFFSKVYYNPDEQRTLLKGLLDKVGEKARAIEDKTFTPIDDDPEQFLARVLDTILPSWLYTAKDPSFNVEKEWRLVFLPAVSEEGYVTPKEIQFRSGKIGLVPYIELRSDQSAEASKGPRLPIVSVKCGPNVDPNLAQHAVRLLLRKNDCSGVEITASAIPVRM